MYGIPELVVYRIPDSRLDGGPMVKGASRRMSAIDNKTSIISRLAPITASFTLKDHTYDVIRAAILDMNIYDDAADLRMDEREMAENLGISRTPIREALARLAQDDLVEIIPRRGVFVKRKSMSEVLEMIITWAALESMAARLACTSTTRPRCRHGSCVVIPVGHVPV